MGVTGPAIRVKGVGVAGTAIRVKGVGVTGPAMRNEVQKNHKPGMTPLQISGI